MKLGFLFPNPRTADGATPVTGTAQFGSAPPLRLTSSLAITIGLLGGALELLASSPAFASGSFYYDIAGGIAKYQQTSPFFGTSTQGSTGYGYALNNGVFVNFGGDKRAFAYQFGLQHRLSAASDAAGSYSVQTAYPVLRLQFSRIFIAAGYTPFVWRRANNISGLENYTRARSATALLAEVGILIPITPKFSFGTQGAAQIISNGGARSPKPIIDGTVSMRFYFGFFGSSGGSHTSGEFTGWRYPFGMIR